MRRGSCRGAFGVGTNVVWITTFDMYVHTSSDKKERVMNLAFPFLLKQQTYKRDKQ